MFKLNRLLSLLLPQAASLALFPTATNQAVGANGLEFNGGQMNDGAMINALQALSNNAAPQWGSVGFQTYSGTTLTLTNLAGQVIRLTAGAAVTVTLDNAINVIANIPGPFLGMTFPVTLVGNAATTVATPTVTNTGITLAGTTTLTSGGSRFMQGQITQLYSTTVQALTAGTTFTSITQIGSTNLWTVALSGNSVTSVVGNLLYLGVTTGTLPPGFYPIYSAGTTSIVVALPGTTVWTATAVNLTPPAVVPPTLAPLITLTGMYGMAAGVIVV